MILKLENTDEFDERINLIRNIESMIRLPRPLIQLFLIKMDCHFLITKILLGEAVSRTGRTNQLSFLKEELEIACFDFIGELVKSNKRCLMMYEIQIGEVNLKKMMSLAYTQMINSNLFLRSIMISIIFFYDQTIDLNFIYSSVLCKSVIDNTSKIVTGLLDEIMGQALSPNNKSSVITCLMTIYMTKHLGLPCYESILDLIRTTKKYREELTRIVKIGFLYFSQKPSDS